MNKKSNTKTKDVKNIKKNVKSNNKENIKTKSSILNSIKDNNIYKFLSSNRILIAIIIIIILVFIVKCCSSISNSRDDLEIRYEKSNAIEISKVKKGTVYKSNITVTNNSDKDIYYSINWKDVKNTFKDQTKLLYDLNTMDPDAGFLSKSQVPVAASPIFQKLIIKKGLTHKYIFSIYFEGDSKKEKNNSFTGTIEIEEIK